MKSDPSSLPSELGHLGADLAQGGLQNINDLLTATTGEDSIPSFLTKSFINRVSDISGEVGGDVDTSKLPPEANPETLFSTLQALADTGPTVDDAFASGSGDGNPQSPPSQGGGEVDAGAKILDGAVAGAQNATKPGTSPEQSPDDGGSPELAKQLAVLQAMQKPDEFDGSGDKPTDELLATEPSHSISSSASSHGEGASDFSTQFRDHL